MTQRRLRYALALGGLLTVVGCDMPVAIPLGSTEPHGPYTGSFPLSFTLPLNILTGDTLQLISLAGSAKPTWEVTGPAVFVLDEGSTDTRIATPTPGVVVRGLARGSVTLTAVAGQDRVTQTFLVADSSAVTLRTVSQLQMHVGDDHWLEPHIYDAGGNAFRAEFGWSSTDTTVVSIRRDMYPAPRWLEAHAAGSAKIIVAFRGQRDTIDVVVNRAP